MRMPVADIPPRISSAQRWAIHCALLVASLIIYAIFRSMWTTTETLDHVKEIHGSVLASFFVILSLSALAFGAAAWLQPHWRSRDAARVAVQVWLFASIVYYAIFGCPRVFLLIVIPFFPFCMGALVGHNIGRFHHPAHWDGIEMNLDD